MRNRKFTKSYIPVQERTYLDKRTDGKQDREIVIKGILQKTYEFGFAKQFYKIAVNGKKRGFRLIHIDFEIPPYIIYKGDKYPIDLFVRRDGNEIF